YVFTRSPGFAGVASEWKQRANTSQLLLLVMVSFWLQAIANAPVVETAIEGLAQGSLPLLTRNSSPRGLPLASNARLNMSAVYRGAGLVTTMNPVWLIGAVVGRSLTQSRATPPSGKAAADGDRWLRVVGWIT